jgi:hypothetical protein
MAAVRSMASGTTSRPNASTALPLVQMTVYGKVPSMKNRRPIRINPVTRKPFISRSDEVQKYIEDFCRQVPMIYRGFKVGSEERLLSGKVLVWYPNLRSDVDVEIIWDCLQIAEVVSNDRWIRRKVIEADIDPKNPRAEIMLEVL